MKKYITLFVILFVSLQIFCAGCGYTNTEEESYIRVHVRGDSDSREAQAVKRQVAAVIEYYLADLLEDAGSYDEAYDAIKERRDTISALASAALRRKGCGYGATATFGRETFTERTADGVTLPAGEYDALIVKLGSGGGDNWWGIVYPTTCFPVSSEPVQYKSLLREIAGGGK